MKAKLCKIDKEYFLHSIENNLIATSDNLHINCLSMKNCQAIERGYDLDELADIEFSLGWNSEIRKIAFKKGFQKALELMGDKKYSEEDLKRVFIEGSNWTKDESLEQDTTFGQAMSKSIQSLQQTEWDVKIMMETVDYGLDEGGNPQYSKEAKLDSNGCLILKIAK